MHDLEPVRIGSAASSANQSLYHLRRVVTLIIFLTDFIHSENANGVLATHLVCCVGGGESQADNKSKSAL